MNEKKIFLIMLICLVLCFSGCEANNHTPSLSSEDLNSTVEPMAEAGTLSGTLTIAYPGFRGSKNFVMEEAIAGFQRRHPDVSINVSDVNVNIDEGYVEKATVSLLSGEPIDVIDTNYLNLQKTGKSGVFVDLNEFFAWDSNHYYTNVVEACTLDGALLGVPTQFCPIVFWTDKKITDTLGVDIGTFDSISFEDLDELCSQAIEQGICQQPYYLFEDMSKRDILGLELPCFSGSPGSEPNYNTQEFIQYLDEIKSFHAKSQADIPYVSTGVPTFTNYFAQLGYAGTHNMAFPTHSDPNINQAVLLRLKNGKVPFITTGMLSIPASSENKELAWEFIRYMTEGGLETEQGESVGVPGLTREGWHTYIREQYAHQFAKGGVTDLESQMSKLDDMMEKLSYWSTTDYALWEPLGDTIVHYFDNDMGTADELAKTIQDRAWIYLNE